MHKTFLTFVLAAMLAIPADAQTQPTSAELLQRGIFAQETAGDLDGAIKIFHQIVDSHPIQREIGAQAQYRLGMTLLSKGDAATASIEIQRLGWDYPDYKDLIASANKGGGLQHPANTFFFNYSGQALQSHLVTAASGFRFPEPQIAQHEALFNWQNIRTVTGTVVAITWSNPYTTLVINSVAAEPPVHVFVASANTLTRAGWTRDTIGKPGDQVTVTGALATDGSSTMQATEVTFNGQVIFSRPNGPMPQNAVGAYEK
jgi:hypothetical protein